MNKKILELSDILSIQDHILDIYAQEGQYKLPAARKRESERLLVKLDRINDPRVIGAKIPPFYIKLLLLIHAQSSGENENWLLEQVAQREIAFYMESIGLSLDENKE